MASTPQQNGIYINESAPFNAPLAADLPTSTVLLIDQTKSQVLEVWADQPWAFFWTGAAVPPAIPTPNQATGNRPARQIPANTLVQVQYIKGMQIVFAGGGGATAITGFRAVTLGAAGTVYVNELRAQSGQQ